MTATTTFDLDPHVLASPWARFWARQIDVVLYSLPAAFALGSLFPTLFVGEAFSRPGGEFVAGMIVLPLGLLIDAVVLGMTGSSPGKALAGIYLATEGAAKVPLGLSLRRSTQMYVQGLVFGIPLIAAIGYIAAHADVKEHGTTKWDRATETNVYAGSNNIVRTVLTGAIALLALGVSNALGRAQ